MEQNLFKFLEKIYDEKNISKLFALAVSLIVYLYFSDILIASLTFLIILFLFLLIKEFKKKYLKNKKIRFFIENFEEQSNDRKRILWSVFYLKKVPVNADRDLYFFIFYEIIEKKLSIGKNGFIYKLNEKVFKFLQDKHEQQVINHFKNLTENEQKVLEIFYEKQNISNYEHPWIDKEMYQALLDLTNKHILEYDYDKSIKIKKDILKFFKKCYKKEKLSREIIILNLENIAPIGKGGTGANPLGGRK